MDREEWEKLKGKVLHIKIDDVYDVPELISQNGNPVLKLDFEIVELDLYESITVIDE